MDNKEDISSVLFSFEKWLSINISSVVDPFHFNMDPDPQIRFVK